MAGTGGPATTAGAPPVPTVVRSGVSECGATVTGDSLTVLEAVLERQRDRREQLEAARTEAFRAGRDPFAVELEAVETPERALPAAARDWLRCVSDDRWHEIHRSMLLAGYPPGQDDGRCSPATATAAIGPGESAGAHTLRCGVDRVRPLPAAPDGCLRVTLDGDDRAIDVTLDAPRDIDGLLADADQVSLTRHSAAALATARSLGGALADTPPISISFERTRSCREYGDVEQGVGTLVDVSLVDRIEAAPPFPEGSTPQLLARALDEGPFTTDEHLAVARLAAGLADSIRLRYGESVPRLVAGIAGVLDCRLVPVPQLGEVVLAAGDVPPALDRLAATFPGAQHLTAEQRESLAAALGTPEDAVAVPTRVDRYRATATAAELAHAEELSVEAAFFLQVSPWVPSPTPAAVEQAVDRGRALVTALDTWAATVEPSILHQPLQTCWDLAAGGDTGPIPGVD